MMARVGSIVFAGLVLVGCAWSWAPFKAYEGPDLAPAELAVVRTKPPGVPNEWVYRVTREGVTYYQAKNRRDGVGIGLRPGYYQITLEGQCTANWAPSRHTAGATLRAGHTYRIRTGCCFGFQESLCFWLEDIATGEDVTRSKTTRIPFENRGIMGEDAPL